SRRSDLKRISPTLICYLPAVYNAATFLIFILPLKVYLQRCRNFPAMVLIAPGKVKKPGYILKHSPIETRYPFKFPAASICLIISLLRKATNLDLSSDSFLLSFLTALNRCHGRYT